MSVTLSVNLEKVARFTQGAVPVALVVVGLLGHYVSFYFHFVTVTLFLVVLLDLYYRYGQTQHALLKNFGVLAQARYVTESIGPELRQYLFAGDLTEKPFNRLERAEVYRKAESYGAHGHRITAAGQLETRLRECLAQGGVHVIEVPIDYSENERVLGDELREKTCAL